MSIYFVRGIVLNTTGNSKNMGSCAQEAHVLVASLTTAITCLYSHQPEPSLLPPHLPACAARSWNFMPESQTQELSKILNFN